MSGAEVPALRVGEIATEGTKVFADLTKRLTSTGNMGGRIAIYLDEELLTDPVVRMPILEGKGIIEGNFTMETAKTLAIQLNSGAVPMPVTVISAELR